MFCIVSFVILSILGIFSASNRELARESIDCVFRRVTFRPCNTGFDEKMKAKILGVVITRSESAARFLNRFFEPLSWAFFIAMLLSLVFFVRGLYLFYITGSCNGENSTAFCVFDPTGANNQASQVEAVCTVPASIDELKLNIQGIDQLGLPQLNPQAGENIIMIACYHCEYSRKAYPLVRRLVERFDAGLTFVHYPVKEPTDQFSRLAYCVNKLEPEKFWEFNDLMFEGEAADLDDDAYLDNLLERSGLDPAEIGTCTAAAETEAIVAEQMQQIVDTGFTGTPTVLIRDQLFIGPKPFRVYAIALEGLLYWMK
jgi:protein-disulfide isomerase